YWSHRSSGAGRSCGRGRSGRPARSGGRHWPPGGDRLARSGGAAKRGRETRACGGAKAPRGPRPPGPPKGRGARPGPRARQGPPGPNDHGVIIISLNQCSGPCNGYHALNTWTNVSSQGYAWATNSNTSPANFTHNGAGTITILQPGLYMITLYTMAIPTSD